MTYKIVSSCAGLVYTVGYHNSYPEACGVAARLSYLVKDTSFKVYRKRVENRVTYWIEEAYYINGE